MNSEDEFLEIEAEGYKKGHNPVMGEFNRKFNFAPISYVNPNANKFKEEVREAIADIQYLYFGEVKLEITTYCSEQKRLETSELADLDNYAKLLCDGLKGPQGILIDDTQIQSLSISWIDVNCQPYFEIYIKGHPDDFVLGPIALYEMPNGLFYPISARSWTKDGIKEMSEKHQRILLAVLHDRIGSSKEFRAELRKSGRSPTLAYENNRYVLPILSGLPKGRIVGSGFEISYVKDWEPRINPKEIVTKLKKHLP
ncbi:MAG TPA: RusA family crossover junction endodeoxyribonuclease, partial [Candidatus Bathyarchaeia archaeon]|nr:RusA family crossover junction endodeoxyribonuclease [Candidatus Bathyarchaeia archaeon]